MSRKMGHPFFIFAEKLMIWISTVSELKFLTTHCICCSKVGICREEEIKLSMLVMSRESFSKKS